MSIRNLNAVFRPRSIALIGASPTPGSVGRVVAENLLKAGFTGPIMPVNPRHTAVAGVLAYPDVGSLPMAPDLAVICTPPATVPGLIAELGNRGGKGAIVITAGFKELGNEAGRALEQAILDAARPHLMRIVGPNCVGVISTASRLNASFAHVQPAAGTVAFVTQSGAMATTVLDWAASRKIGFSHVVSLGDMTDVDFGDMLDYLATDPQTTAILLYIEALTASRKFMSAARAAARLKPVIAIKAGRHAAAARAAASHTGALAGVDAVYAAAFRRAGMLRVHDLDEVFDAVETLAARWSFQGDRLAILTNGGGVGVLATDALMEQGGLLAELSPATIASLGSKLPPTWSKGNPVDIIGDAKADRYAFALDGLLAAPEVDAVLVLNCPTAIASGVDAAKSVIATAGQYPGRVLTSWLGSDAAAPARQLFASTGIPTYDTPEKAVRGFMHLVRHRRNQRALLETPPSIATDVAPDEQTARGIVESAAARGAVWLDALDVRKLLSCYGIAAPELILATDADRAAIAAQTIGRPVALKIMSADITHKSDVGGVVLDLVTPRDVMTAARDMQKRIASRAPKARIDGFLVQEMVHRATAHELILGMTVDAQFGPVLLFGHGGTAVEVIDDKALALPPLNLALAKDMIARTRVYRQLRGYRDRPPADLEAIAITLVKLSQMISDLDEIAELDINPLLADADGVIALDARIRIAALRAGELRGQRLAIRPYPKHLERIEVLPGLGKALLRPVRPEDESAFLRFFDRLSPEDIRLRFFAPLRELPKTQLARLTQIDYDREMALVLETSDKEREILGVVRIAADPDNQRAEFALTVRSDLKGRGIGTLLLSRMIDYASDRGTGEVFGDVLGENSMMLALCRDLGFSLAPLPEGGGIVRVSRDLRPA